MILFSIHFTLSLPEAKFLFSTLFMLYISFGLGSKNLVYNQPVSHSWDLPFILSPFCWKMGSFMEEKFLFGHSWEYKSWKKDIKEAQIKCDGKSASNRSQIADTLTFPTSPLLHFWLFCPFWVKLFAALPQNNVLSWFCELLATNRQCWMGKRVLSLI